VKDECFALSSNVLGGLSSLWRKMCLAYTVRDVVGNENFNITLALGK